MKKEEKQEIKQGRIADTYLGRVHLELSHNLDGNLFVDTLAISCTVDVTESTIAHLLDEAPSFQSGVSRELALGLTLLCNDALEHFGVDILSSLFLLLLLVDGLTSGSSGLGSDMTVVDGGC